VEEEKSALIILKAIGMDGIRYDSESSTGGAAEECRWEKNHNRTYSQLF
jgi:hypothetical protein